MIKRDIDAILSELTLAEKASLCSGLDGWHTKPVERLEVGAVAMSDGTCGIRKENPGPDGKPVTEKATCFPCECLSACSFDRDLMREMGAAIAAEARAKGVNLLLGPGVNIKRNPLCGRNFEYFSEDPFLTGELACAFIDGLQNAGVGATLKHFALNNQEKARLSSNSVADERARREVYLAAFERVVKRADPWAVMSSYNKADGVYTSENDALLRGTLRGEWGYSGLVMSDWGAVCDRPRALSAGLDLEMPASGGFQDKLIETAVSDGRIDMETLDGSARRVLELEAKARACEARFREPAPGEDAQHELARRFAAESMVLLKNEGGILPLSGESIAVIGEFARTPRYQGGGSANIRPTKLSSFLDGAAAYRARLPFAPGYDPARDEADDALIAQAARLAQGSETVLLFAGLPNRYECEGYDRKHMRLPEGQNELIRSVAAANPNTVVVLFAGGPVEMPWIGGVKAVLMAYLPGQAGGGAVADVLFGKASPSGKLAETFPLREEDCPSHNFFGQEHVVEYRESVFVGYRYFGSSRPVLFPFGHGLSYSRFEYGALDVARLPGGSVRVRFALTNAGDVPAAEAAQLYVRAPRAQVPMPEMELRAFEKAFLQPGETRRIELTLEPRAFSFYNALAGDFHILPGEYGILVGASSRDIRLEGSVRLENSDPDAAIPDYREIAPEYYDLSKLPWAKRASFEALLGRPLPEYRSRPFTRVSTLKEIRATFPGRLLYRLVRKIAFGGNASPVQEGYDLTMMFEAQFDYMPIFAMVTGTKGSVGFEALDALVAALNGRFFYGASRFLRAMKKKKGAK